MAKSEMVRGMLFGAEFFIQLHKKVVKLGGSEEAMYAKMKDESFIEQTAKLIVAGVNGAKKLALKALKLVTDNIQITTEPFTKNSFFKKNGPVVKLYFHSNFEEWILNAIPDVIPAFTSTLTKTQLTTSMWDSQILAELQNPKPFTITEFAAILRDLLTRQSNGEDGTLLTNGSKNIFYIQLENGRVVIGRVRWFFGGRGWECFADRLDADDLWHGSGCVFSRS